MLPEAAAERELPFLSGAFGTQAFPKQLWIIEALVDLLFSIAPHAVETTTLVNFERIKSTLKIRRNDFIAPLAG